MNSDKEFLIQVRADIQQALTEFRKMSGESGRTAREIEKAAGSTNRLEKGMDRLTVAMAGAVGVAVAWRRLKMADEFNVLQSRIKVATKATGDHVKVSAELYRQAQDTGVAVATNVSVFQRLSRSRAELNTTNREILQVTQSVQQLGVISGATSVGMQAGLLQFSQAMGAGVVRAEEFNSIMENLPELANRIAAGMGMTTGQLRQAVLSGEVLSRDVFEAILKQSPEINREFSEFDNSLGKATQRLDNAFNRFLANAGKSTNLLRLMMSTIDGVAAGMDRTSEYLNPQGSNKFNLLLHERARLLQQIERVENSIYKNAFFSNSEEQAAALRAELSRVNAEIVRMRDENVKAIESGQKNGEGSAASMAEYESRLKSIQGELKGLISLQKQQADALRDAQQASQAMAQSFVDARAGLGSQRGANLIDITTETANAERLAGAGDYDAAAEAAERAREMIVALGEEGTESEAVLKGLLKRAERVGVASTKALESSRRQTLEDTNAAIADLLAEAEQLKSLTVGFDAAQASVQAQSLLAALTAEFAANPLVIPVVYDVKAGLSVPEIQDTSVPEIQPIRRASGGLLRGPGTGTSDSILMLGSNGEYVIRADAVRHYGARYFDALNHMRVPRFADGGLVTHTPKFTPEVSPPAGAGGVPINLYLDGQRYPVHSSADVAKSLRATLHREVIKRGAK